MVVMIIIIIIIIINAQIQPAGFFWGVFLLKEMNSLIKNVTGIWCLEDSEVDWLNVWVCVADGGRLSDRVSVRTGGGGRGGGGFSEEKKEDGRIPSAASHPYWLCCHVVFVVVVVVDIQHDVISADLVSTLVFSQTLVNSGCLKKTKQTKCNLAH